MIDSEYKRKEHEILSCFGGTKNILKRILKNQDSLSFVEQKRLSQVLKKPLPTKIDRETAKTTDILLHATPNKEKKKKPLILSHLNENCLSNVFQFLNSDDRNSFSFTSRAICIASKNKSSYLHHDVLSFPLHKVYHFLHKLSEINDPSDESCTHQFEMLTAWIHHQSHTKQDHICNIISKSGLLSSFSQWLTEEQLVVQHMDMIQGIVHLFHILSRSMTKFHQYHLINVDLIENLKILMDTMLMHKIDYSDSEIIPNIVSIIAALTVLSDDIPWQRSVLERIYISGIIATFIPIVRAPNLFKCKKDIVWISKANTLISSRLEMSDDPATIQVLSDHITPQCIAKMNSIIDVKSGKGWIYELISKGRLICIRDPVVHPPLLGGYDYQNWFTVSDVVEISSPIDTDPMTHPTITLIGQFNKTSCSGHWPDRQISVPLSHIHCIPNKHLPNGIYHEIMEFLHSICRVIAAGQKRYAFYDLDDTNHIILQSLKRAIKVSQHQFMYYPRKDILCTLLEGDWGLFMNLLSEEVQVEFDTDKVHLRDLNRLMTIAWNTSNLQCLCRREWFKQRLFEGTEENEYLRRQFEGTAREELLYSIPSDWTQDIVIELIKQLHNDHESYLFLSRMMAGLKYTDHSHDSIPINMEFFIQENGIHYVLLMILNSFNKNDWCDEWMELLIGMFAKHFCATSTCSLLRNAMQNELHEIEEDTKDGVLAVWWETLRDMLMRNLTNELGVKSVLNEMQWFIATYRYPVHNLVSSSAIALQDLQRVQRLNFQDREIHISLQSLLSSFATW